MVKLKTLMGTKYIIDAHVNKLQEVLTECGDKSEVVDLGYCRFGHQSEAMLRKFYYKVTFVNSAEEDLDKILKHNNSAVNYRGKRPVFLITSSIASTEELKALFLEIKANKSDVVYQFNEYQKATVKCRSIAILMLLKFPNACIDMGGKLGDIFKQVRVDWLKSKKQHSSYLEVCGRSIGDSFVKEGSAVVERIVEEGYVYVPGTGKVKEELYVEEFNVLPGKFSREVLVMDEEFKATWRNATAAFEQAVTCAQEVVTMQSYIELRQ